MHNWKKTFILLILSCFLLTSCQGKPASDDADRQMSPAEISEQAMDNFLSKINEGNYTIRSNDFLTTYVYSKDLVWFDYADDAYWDFAVMSINDESFQGYLDEDSISDVQFLNEGPAIEAASTRLPTYLLEEEVSGGNIYELFYNQTEEPLTFVSYDERVKRMLMSFAGYGEQALRLMEEVYLELDAIDVTSAHFKAVVNDDLVARIDFDDIDVVITFGESEGNELAQAWMKAPEYPEARTAWSDADLFVLNSVFLPGYGQEALPFIPSASYALTFDEDFITNDEVNIRDSHVSEKDMQDYIDLLLKEGFKEEKVVDEDGERTVYRRILRKDFDCYSSVELSYDNGMNLTARKYYDFPVYEGLDAINKRIVSLGYEALPASDNFIEVSGKDTANELTESWLYFFTYDSALYVDIDVKDMDEMNSYLEGYIETLKENGFTPVQESEEEVSYYESADGYIDFRYRMIDEDTVTLLFKAEKKISATEAEKMIKDVGFPTIRLSDPMTCRNLTLFHKVQYGQDYKLYLSFDQTFASAGEAEEFLNAYESSLNDAGFDRVNPDNVGSRKQIAIYNEEKDLLVGIDFIDQGDNALVNFDFSAE